MKPLLLDFLIFKLLASLIGKSNFSALHFYGLISLRLFSKAGEFGAAPAPKIGLFFGGGAEQLWYQFVGLAAVGGFSVVFSFIAWYVISLITGGIRVSEEEEFKGLDISEHGMEAYPGFVKENEG